ncbi:MAG: sodium:solute symporter, partial [Bacteroidota bacterium]
TFISVPCWVGESQFSYMQMVLGYLPGYFVIANILLPLYYRLNLTSIYTYLDERFGRSSYKTGSVFFLISRAIGASFRLFLVANVLQISMFDKWNVPFFVTVMITILLIWLYTNRGGIKTIIWTDSLQTFSMLAAVFITIILVSRRLNLDFIGFFETVASSSHSKIFFFDDWQGSQHFVKQFLAGMFITIVMTGLDQDMMQKNLSCRNLKDAKKNMYLYSAAFVPVNLLFLSLGALLYIFAANSALTIPERSDDIFPMLATGGFLPPIVGIFFIIGLIAAAYSSADSALTALTTSFTVDILDGNAKPEETVTRIRKMVHVGISIFLLLLILLFRAINNQSVISAIFTVAGYTYGPLLGMYAFGLFTRMKIIDRWVPFVAVLSPGLTFIINYYSETWFGGYKFGFELLIVNGLITFTGLLVLSFFRKKKKVG